MYKRTNKHFCFLLPALSLLLIALQDHAQILSASADSVLVQISNKYSNPSLLTKIFMGSNYRSEWETPVMLPILNIKALGLTPKELGGGRQTKSLQLLDKDSVEWALRTIDKDVSPVIPKLIRNKFTLSIVQQMVSAAHPFAPLTIPTLATAVGVPAASPTFYYVPDDPALGKFKDIFANTICLVERRNILPGKFKTDNAEKMIGRTLENDRYAINQEAYLRARLLDMLIADWDRHYDQWRWLPKDSAAKIVYYALPKDRDQAYFYSHGLLLKFLRLFALKYTVGFSEKTTNIVKLNGVALTLDQFIITELNKSDWERIANDVYNHLSDEIITGAIRKMPQAIYALNGTTITQKLIDRKKTIAADVMKYYGLLSQSVTIRGTDGAENFNIAGGKDSITITVYGAKDSNAKLYRRTFYPDETKEIIFLGLGGDDAFATEQNLETAIKIKIDGGKGANKYSLSPHLKSNAKDSDMDANSYKKTLRKKLRIRD